MIPCVGTEFHKCPATRNVSDFNRCVAGKEGAEGGSDVFIWLHLILHSLLTHLSSNDTVKHRHRGTRSFDV